MNQVGYTIVTRISLSVHILPLCSKGPKTWNWADLSMLGVKMVGVDDLPAIWDHQSAPSSEITTEHDWMSVQE